MHEDFLTIRSFSERKLAENLMSILKEYHIPFILEDNSTLFNPSFANNSIDKVFEIKVQAIDFEKVESLLHFEAQESIDDIDANHYLHEFTDEELIKLLKEPDLWGEYDYVAAQLLLRKRSLHVSQDQLDVWKKERLAILSMPKHYPSDLVFWSVVGLFTGGFLGFFVNYYVLSATKVLPNGTKVATFDVKAQKIARYLLLLNSLCLLIALFVAFNFFAKD